MKDSLITGLSFGMTSGVITTMGLMIGLQSGTNSRAVVIGGILTIAIADAFSDALGIHISEEAENVHTESQIWAATISTFLAKFLFALTFLVPIMLFELKTAIVIGVCWGMSVLTIISYMMAKAQKQPIFNVISEHLLIASAVIAITHYVGIWISGITSV
jgi:VIT1/CCC1 family predicted Fe2+/Mn2+ transporter